MSASISLTTPLRFYEIGSGADYLTVWPTPDNVLQRQKWQDGIEAVEYWYKDHVVNQLLSIQFSYVGVTDQNIYVFKYNQSTGVFDAHSTLTPTDITPSGWVSDSVNKYDFTPAQEGLYYLEYTEPGWRSDEFVVHTDEKYRKRLVEIEYYNTENILDTIFFDGIVQKYTGKTYFEGHLKKNNLKNEYSQFVRDEGGVKRLRSTPIRSATLVMANVHYTYADIINWIFSLDTIVVNGVQYVADDTPNLDPIDKTDLVNITISLTRSESNNLIT